MSNPSFASIAALEYHDVSRPEPPPIFSKPAERPVTPTLNEEQVQARLALARAQAIAETEQRLRSEWETREGELQASLTETLRNFAEDRSSYFAKIEPEVVQLSLSIARKILQREVQLDPLLLSALVRVTLDRMQSGPGVRIRVPLTKVSWWEQQTGVLNGGRFQCEIVGEPELASDDCIMETDLGSANLSLEVQLKEVEKGFFDLLAHRPRAD